MANYREGPTGPKDFAFGFVVGLIVAVGLMYWILTSVS